MKVTVFGAGYVGLVQAAVLAEHGHKVICVDIDDQRVANLRNGIIPIHEPGLSDLILSEVARQSLSFTTDAAAAVQFAEFIFIAVGTPPDENGDADLKHVLAVADTIGTHLDVHKIVAIKSTVPPGSSKKVHQTIDNALCRKGLPSLLREKLFDVVSNPEFLKEGSALKDCRSPDRIILGTTSESVASRMEQLYAPFVRNHSRTHVMTPESAELTKYASNAMLATKISFMNQMAHIAESVGADIEQVREGMGSDPRIGYHFIYPGIGFGGSCFPKDVSALRKTCEEHGIPGGVLSAIEDVNHRQKTRLNHHINQQLGFDLRGKTFAVWGLAFKPNTDDMREAPSLEIINKLILQGAEIVAYDPESMKEAHKILGQKVRYVDNMYDALNDADCLIICTEWKCFRAPDFSDMQQRMRGKFIFDGRNVLNPSEVEALGFEYFGIGRGRSIKQ